MVELIVMVFVSLSCNTNNVCSSTKKPNHFCEKFYWVLILNTLFQLASGLLLLSPFAQAFVIFSDEGKDSVSNNSKLMNASPEFDHFYTFKSPQNPGSLQSL